MTDADNRTNTKKNKMGGVIFLIGRQFALQLFVGNVAQKHYMFKSEMVCNIAIMSVYPEVLMWFLINCFFY